MPDFSKYSNYDEKTSFSGVTFGANAPVLEVEQNELQQIADTKIKRLTDIIGSCVHPMSDGDVSFNPSTKVLTLTKCVVIAHGFTAFISSANITMSASNKVAYVKLEEKTVTGAQNLKEYGNTQGGSTSNTIYDSRVGTETSRRRLIEVTLMCSNALPGDTDTVHYAPIGTYEGNEFVPEFVMNSLTDLGMIVQDGALCYVFDDGN